jgi:DNA-binding HxlR family transcriptional regulator
MTAPLPGSRVRGSRSGRPIMALLDLLGRRQALRIVWELRDGKPWNFRELGERCGGISPSVQNGRLAELREARIVAHAVDGGYRLTASGMRLVATLGSLNAWAETWAKELGKQTGRQAGRQAGKQAAKR